MPLRKARFCVIFFMFLSHATNAYAHGGGLDKNGCHTNKKTGDHHCHNRPLNKKPKPVPKNDFIKSQKSGSVYYKNCSEARASTRTPFKAGEPGYGKHLDRDGDGLACE